MPNLYSLFKDFHTNFGLGSLVICGCFLILVNALTHFWISRWDFNSKNKDQVHQNLKPLLQGCAALISRIVEILITHKSSTIEAIQSYNPEGLASRIKDQLTTGDDFNRHETTAYRLINFLALMKYFERQTVGIKSFPLLDRIEYFLQHKIAVGARGNLYGVKLLSTETQEDMASCYLNCDTSMRAADLTIGMFLNRLKENKYPLVYFQNALAFVGIVPPYYKEWISMDRSAPAWRHTLALAQFAIYLIDFYQEHAQDPQWEEQRVFFVKLVKQWNVDSNGKTRHLYVHGDMESSNYINTFPPTRTSGQSAMFSSLVFQLSLGTAVVVTVLINLCLTLVLPWSALFWPLLGLTLLVFVEKCWRPLSFVKKLCVLNIRGSRFGKRHYPKRIWPKGVVIKGAKQDYNVDSGSDLRTVHERVNLWLHERLLDD